MSRPSRTQAPVTTVADRAIEAAQRERHPGSRPTPDHGILSARNTATRGWMRTFVWVLDPIGGTRAFLNGIPVFTNLIGLAYQDGDPAPLGVIDQPTLGGTVARRRGPPARHADGSRRGIGQQPGPALAEVYRARRNPGDVSAGRPARRVSRVSAQRRAARRYGTDCYVLRPARLRASCTWWRRPTMKVRDYLPDGRSGPPSGRGDQRLGGPTDSASSPTAPSSPAPAKRCTKQL